MSSIAKIPASTLLVMCGNYLDHLNREREASKKRWIDEWLKYHANPSWIAKLFGRKHGTDKEAAMAYDQSDSAVFSNIKHKDKVDAAGLRKLCKLVLLNDAQGLVYVDQPAASVLYGYLS